VSYPFKYKEVEKNLAEVGVLPYTSKGMRFVKFIYIKVSDVIHDFKNPARENAILEGDVTNIENIIKSGNYRGFAFVPPVVNEKGVLIAGHHRLEGHIGEDEEYMWVALCAFDDDKAEFDYNVLENQMVDTFEKKVSTNGDLINSTLIGLQKGHIDLGGLEDYVKGLKKSPSDKRIILEEIKKKMGIKIDAHRPLSREKIASEYAIETGGNEVVDHQANIAIGDNIFNNARILTTLLPKIVNGEDVNVIYKTNDTVDLEHLNEERERLIKEMSPEFLYSIVKPFVDAYENGTAGSVTLNFPKQYESDSSVSYKLECNKTKSQLSFFW
jgi:hypothetical protein